MNCPRCGENMYGSVCPRCGNVVMSGRYTANSRSNISNRNNRTSSNRNYDSIQIMDNNRMSQKPLPKKTSSLSSIIYKLIIIVLIILCAVFFFKYRSVNEKLTEAQASINTLNESIKSKDEEINKLKTVSTQQDNSDDNDENDDSPSVEFDENGNLLNVSEGKSNTSDDSNSEDSNDENSDNEDEPTEYNSGDTYIVKEGDTGSDICNKVYGEYKEELWEKLLAANGMTASSSYHPGDELKIP